MHWAEPTPCRALGAAAPLTGEQVRSWRERGFAHVGGLFDPETIADAVELYGAEFEPDPDGSQGQRQLGGEDGRAEGERLLELALVGRQRLHGPRGLLLRLPRAPPPRHCTEGRASLW